METVYPQIVTSADMLKSTIQLEQLIHKLKMNNAKAAAITNSKLYGVLPFWHDLQKHGIHPVIGLSLRVKLHDEVVFLIIYAENNKGYENMLKISSSLETRELTELPQTWLEAYKDGLLVVYKGDSKFSEEILQQLINIFQSKNLFIGMERPNGVKLEDEIKIMQVSEDFSIPITTYHLSRYIEKEDAFAYEVLDAMDQSVKMSDRNRLKPSEVSAHVLTETEWMERFSDVPEWYY